MGRGAYEHNYTQLALPELAIQEADAAPVTISLATALTGDGPAAADVYCADNRALLEHAAAAWAARYQLIYLDPPFGSGKVYAARVAGSRGMQARLCNSGTLYVHLDWHAVH